MRADCGCEWFLINKFWLHDNIVHIRIVRGFATNTRCNGRVVSLKQVDRPPPGRDDTDDLAFERKKITTLGRDEISGAPGTFHVTTK